MPLPGTARRLLAASILAILLTLTWGASPALATYPGTNGRIAFAANLSGTWQVWTMRPDGTGLKQLTHLPDRGWPFLLPDWSPDATHILFTLPDSTGVLQIYRVNADGTGLVKLTHGSGDSGNADWSPDGSKIVLDRVGPPGGMEAIYVMKADGTGLKRLTSNFYGNFAATFTPNGRHIVYESQKGGLDSAIWIMNADGSNKRRLTPAKLEAGRPDVSPDGTHVVFMNNEDEQHTETPNAIYSMSLNGTGITRLTDPGCCHHDGEPTYSPNGQRIVFVTDRNYPLLDGLDIYDMNADGSNQQQVTTNIGGCRDNFGCGDPDWGPRP
jgi:Tol biopolymer transport system component